MPEGAGFGGGAVCAYVACIYGSAFIHLNVCVCVHMFVCMGSCECEPTPVSEDVVCWEQQSVTNC